mmetsp:Transcript_51776/g.145439  ORF Transcript_51776/g.145439 Transcript_51776/m.145439 type:complete len:275 (-) Transcript_51776:209-1033(-)
MEYDYGESIYQIIPPKIVPPIKPAMHRSKHDPKTPPSASTFHQRGTTHPHTSNLEGLHPEKPVGDRSARTMGSVPGTARSCPTAYLKSKAQRVPALADIKRTNPDILRPTVLSARLKPAVPSRHETPIHNLVTSKNFVMANAVEAILSTPRERGDSGKDYLRKEDYGKVPKYLAHIKRDIQDEFDYIRQLQQREEDAHKSLAMPLDELERLRLIEGLKAKWEQLNTAYQGTTHLTKLDTIGKIKRKEHHEAELHQIEKDIEKLNRKNIIVDATC